MRRELKELYFALRLRGHAKSARRIASIINKYAEPTEPHPDSGSADNAEGASAEDLRVQKVKEIFEGVGGVVNKEPTPFSTRAWKCTSMDFSSEGKPVLHTASSDVDRSVAEDGWKMLSPFLMSRHTAGSTWRDESCQKALIRNAWRKSPTKKGFAYNYKLTRDWTHGAVMGPKSPDGGISFNDARKVIGGDFGEDDWGGIKSGWGTYAAGVNIKTAKVWVSKYLEGAKEDRDEAFEEAKEGAKKASWEVVDKQACPDKKCLNSIGYPNPKSKSHGAGNVVDVSSDANDVHIASVANLFVEGHPLSDPELLKHVKIAKFGSLCGPNWHTDLSSDDITAGDGSYYEDCAGAGLNREGGGHMHIMFLKGKFNQAALDAALIRYGLIAAPEGVEQDEPETPDLIYRDDNAPMSGDICRDSEYCPYDEDCIADEWSDLRKIVYHAAFDDWAFKTDDGSMFFEADLADSLADIVNSCKKN